MKHEPAHQSKTVFAMNHSIKRVFALTSCFFFVIAAQAQTDEEGVYNAVLDYVEGFYNVEPERFEKSISKDLVKYGYWKNPDGEYQGSPMNWDQAYQLASRWNVDNRQNMDENTPKEIWVMEVLDKTAVAKLTAQWGIDYFQLEKNDGVWQIGHVIWQAHPPTDG